MGRANHKAWIDPALPEAVFYIAAHVPEV